MKDSKKAPTGVATSAGATAEAETEQTTTSTKNDITSGAGLQMVHIADFLSHGAENGVTITDLERLTDLDNRTIRLMIQGERLHGVPILSDCRSGYYLPENELERAQCVRSLLHRAKEIERVARAIEEATGLD